MRTTDTCFLPNRLSLKVNLANEDTTLLTVPLNRPLLLKIKKNFFSWQHVDVSNAKVRVHRIGWIVDVYDYFGIKRVMQGIQGTVFIKQYIDGDDSWLFPWIYSADWRLCEV